MVSQMGFSKKLGQVGLSFPCQGVELVGSVRSRFMLDGCAPAAAVGLSPEQAVVGRRHAGAEPAHCALATSPAPLAAAPSHHPTPLPLHLHRWHGAARAATPSWARRWRSPPTARASRRTPLTRRSRCAALSCPVLCSGWCRAVQWLVLRLACTLPPAPVRTLALHRSLPPWFARPGLTPGNMSFPPLPVFSQDIVDRAYRRAKDLVQQNIKVLHECADLLMEREQIDGEDLQVGTPVHGREGRCSALLLPLPLCCRCGCCCCLRWPILLPLSRSPRFAVPLTLPCVSLCPCRRRCWWRRRLSST